MNRQILLIVAAVSGFAAVAEGQSTDTKATSRPSAAAKDTVLEIAVWGQAELEPGDLATSIQTTRGQRVDSATLAADRDRIVAFYKARGFAHARATVEQVAPKAGAGHGTVVVFRIVEGPQVPPQTRKTRRG